MRMEPMHDKTGDLVLADEFSYRPQPVQPRTPLRFAPSFAFGSFWWEWVGGRPCGRLLHHSLRVAARRLAMVFHRCVFDEVARRRDRHTAASTSRKSSEIVCHVTQSNSYGGSCGHLLPRLLLVWAVQCRTPIAHARISMKSSPPPLP